MKRTEKSERKTGNLNCYKLILEKGIVFVRKFYADKMINSSNESLIVAYWQGYADCIKAYDLDNSP